jgi:hypothetical protein
MLPELAAGAPRPEAGDAEQLRFRLFDAVVRLLTESSSAKPIMLVLDDLHDADVVSLQLLKFVARMAHNARLTIVGTYRDAEMRHSQERAAIILDILRDATRLPLAGLAEDEVGRMVEMRAQRALTRSSSWLSVARPRVTRSLSMESSGFWQPKASSGASSPSPGELQTSQRGVRSDPALARSALTRGAHPAHHGGAERAGVRAWIT